MWVTGCGPADVIGCWRLTLYGAVNWLRQLCGADEVVLFERATFLVISHATRKPYKDQHRCILSSHSQGACSLTTRKPFKPQHRCIPCSFLVSSISSYLAPSVAYKDRDRCIPCSLVVICLSSRASSLVRHRVPRPACLVPLSRGCLVISLSSLGHVPASSLVLAMRLPSLGHAPASSLVLAARLPSIGHAPASSLVLAIRLPSHAPASSLVCHRQHHLRGLHTISTSCYPCKILAYSVVHTHQDGTGANHRSRSLGSRSLTGAIVPSLSHSLFHSVSQITILLAHSPM